MYIWHTCHYLLVLELLAEVNINLNSSGVYPSQFPGIVLHLPVVYVQTVMIFASNAKERLCLSVSLHLGYIVLLVHGMLKYISFIIIKFYVHLLCWFHWISY